MTDLREGLSRRISDMSDGQLGLLSMIVDTFEQRIEASRNEASDIVDRNVLEGFGDLLMLHHSLSSSYLDKTRFEVALERLLVKLGRSAHRPASMTNRGHDITVDGERWSLKTQGDRRIQRDSLFISKFMELGGGHWGARDLKDVEGLREQFLKHLEGYDRVFQLRYFRNSREAADLHGYELVEIPKALLVESRNGKLEWSKKSRTNPRCAYCIIRDKSGATKYKLYFDGGGERKLQIKSMRKSDCIVHATWSFETASSPISDDS